MPLAGLCGARDNFAGEIGIPTDLLFQQRNETKTGFSAPGHCTGGHESDALARRRARPLARYAGDGADAVHVGIEGMEDVALARRFAHAADLARLQRPRAEPSHLLVEPSDIERRPVFAVADAVEADFDLALHHVRNHRHNLRCHLLAADLAACKAEGCLLEARRYGQPPHVAGTDSLCAILHRPL